MTTTLRRLHVTHLVAATITKHELAGIVAVVVALAFLVYAGVKLAAKAAKVAMLFTLATVIAGVVAVLLFTRAI